MIWCLAVDTFVGAIVLNNGLEVKGPIILDTGVVDHDFEENRTVNEREIVLTIGTRGQKITINDMLTAYDELERLGKAHFDSGKGTSVPLRPPGPSRGVMTTLSSWCEHRRCTLYTD